MKKEGLWAICSFLTALCANYCVSFIFKLETFWLIYLFGNSVILLILCLSRTTFTAIAWRSALLGTVLAAGLTIISYRTDYGLANFARYLIILSFFHFSEYFFTSIINPHSLNLDSFLLNHSKEYWIALCVGCVEYFLELYFIPSLKSLEFVSYIGCLICLVGEILRKLAMLTAGKGFTHLISYRKKPEHELVTSGIYSLFRHPSYVGWFWWSIGTQVVLCNPLCTVAYAIVSWTFFNDRIYHEEITLINFFGEHYVNYQKRVPTGLPFIQGYHLL